jgi:hypothetical protein
MDRWNNLIKLARTQDPHILFWRTCGWILSTWGLIQGVNYASTGNSRVYSPSLYVLVKFVPGGMRTHGIIMLAITVLFLYTMRTGDQHTRWVLEAFCGYLIFVTIAAFGSWWLAPNKPNYAAPFTWLALAGIAAAMIAFPPTGYRSRP